MVMWILATLAAIVLGRSLFVRAAILHRVRASDYVMIMAFVGPSTPHMETKTYSFMIGERSGS